jgi:hypothetical protein
MDWANDIGPELEARYKTDEMRKKSNYFDNVDTDEFLSSVTPVHDLFYGTKVRHYLVLSYPYEWPPPGYDDNVEKIKKYYDQFELYEVFVYIDGVTLDTTSDPVVTDFVSNVESMCEELSEYGFRYNGVIESEIEADYFFDEIDEFYKDDYGESL